MGRSGSGTWQCGISQVLTKRCTSGTGPNTSQTVPKLHAAPLGGKEADVNSHDVTIAGLERGRKQREVRIHLAESFA
jgi:hypothetical protein